MVRSSSWRVTTAVAALALLAGCHTEKSANPLSPSVAGPIPGVSITAPKLVQPSAGSDIDTTEQPITLVVENATTSGVRPLSYVFEVAADADFTSVMVRREDITPGSDGRTSLRLPDPLQPERTYYWRARALDGANTGPFAAAVYFRVYTQVVIKPPVVIEPAPGSTVTGLRPVFRVQNAVRSGPAGSLIYRFELATDQPLTALVAVVTVPETAGETGFTLAQALEYDQVYYWRVKAFDLDDHQGDFTPTYAFRTPRAPVVPPAPPTPPPAPPPPGGYPNNGPDVIKYVEDRYPEYLAAGVSSAQRVANMEFLRDRIIETGICGGMDLAWNLKRGVGPRSIDAIAWRTGGSVEVVDIAYDYDNTSTTLRLQWVIADGPPGYDPYPTPPCK